MLLTNCSSQSKSCRRTLHTTARDMEELRREKIATVDQTGKVECVGVGDVIITAASTDRSGVVGTYKLTVNKYIAATGISIEPLDRSVCIIAMALSPSKPPTSLQAQLSVL